MTDLIELIKGDHKEIDEAIAELRSTPPESKTARRHIFSTIKALLEWHASAEEEIFYPLLTESEPDDCDPDALITDHHDIENILEEMADMPVDDPRFAVRLNELATIVEQHVAAEEDVAIPAVRDSVSPDRLSHLGDLWYRRREITRTGATGGGLGYSERPPQLTREEQEQDRYP